MKPLRLQLKVRNNILIRLREEAGLSVQQISKQIGIHFQHYYEVEKPGYSPEGRWGKLKPAALKICQFYAMSPAELWPDKLRDMKRSSAEVEASFEQVEQLTSPVQLDQLPAHFDDPALKLDLEEMLQVLKPRERFIVQKLSENYSCLEIGKMLGISGGRVNQISKNYYQKIRHEQQILDDKAEAILERRDH